ncbi:MAG: hypothetical protein ACJA0Q_001367 [Saprospiraceae bacterium]|jgi:hypothetical protein
MIQELKKRLIRSRSFSKYVVGIAILNDNVKYNNFKSNLLYLNEIHENEDVWNPTLQSPD